MELDDLKRNIESVQNALSRSGCCVTLVAATKTVPPETVNAALGLGITDIGENRVQEYLQKRDEVSPAKWHFIGTLQRNKAKYLVGNVSLIQSVNSIALASEISRLAVAKGVVQNVLLEVNAAGEQSKTGAAENELFELAEYTDSQSALRVRGLMAVPPAGADDKVYKHILKLYESLQAGRPSFNVLSVGMSGDYERAVAFGSNMVRIGTAIFGKRR